MKVVELVEGLPAHELAVLTARRWSFAHFTLHLELGNVETCDQALLPFCELFKKGVASTQPAMSEGSKTLRTRSCCAHGKRRPGSTTPS